MQPVFRRALSFILDTNEYSTYLKKMLSLPQIEIILTITEKNWNSIKMLTKKYGMYTG